MFAKHSFRTQITVLCVAMILVTVVTLMLTYWWRTAEFNQYQIDRRMDSAVNVLEQHLAAKEQLLVTAATVLTADFGFKQAVATEDQATIASVLQNHGNRINADLMALMTPEGELISTSSTIMNDQQTFSDSLNNLPIRLQHALYLEFHGSLFQIIELPVKAPRLIAYCLLGFEINQQSLAELKRLTSLDITLLNRQQQVIVSSFAQGLSEDDIGDQSLTEYLQAQLTGSSYQHKKVNFDQSPGITIVLSESLAEENAEFEKLVNSILLISLIALSFALIISRWLALGIAKPLQRLVSASQAIAKGNFSAPLAAMNQSREFTEVNRAFSAMSQEIQQREAEIKFQAEHDPHTGLYNKRRMLVALDHRLQQPHNLSLLGIHIRDFKQINDTMGPTIGDAVLTAVAKRLQRYIATPMNLSSHASVDITYGRIGDDTFLLLLNFPEGAAAWNQQQALLDHLSTPYSVHDVSVVLRFCCGLYAHKQHPSDLEAADLVRRVTIATQAAINEHQTVRTYQTGEDEEYLSRLQIIEQLKRALQADDGQLCMHYQPKLNLKRQKIDTLEALIRWTTPDNQRMNPEVFIALAEQSGLIVQVTQWVIQTVLRQMSIWQQSDHHFDVAINMSAQDIATDGFIEYLLEQVERFNTAPSQLTIEITERDLMSNETLIIHRLNQLKSIGFKVSVDDYGVGQSSLSKLKQLPVNELKIDKSFIMTLDTSPSDQSIVEYTIALGHKLGLSVTAEGVENASTLAMLNELGCNYAQGYHLTRPLDADALIQWVTHYDTSAA